MRNGGLSPAWALISQRRKCGGGADVATARTGAMGLVEPTRVTVKTWIILIYVKAFSARNAHVFTYSQRHRFGFNKVMSGYTVMQVAEN